jgi:hypothetical protein
MGRNPEPIIIRIGGKRVFTGAYVISKGVKKCSAQDADVREGNRQQRLLVSINVTSVVLFMESVTWVIHTSSFCHGCQTSRFQRGD